MAHYKNLGYFELYVFGASESGRLLVQLMGWSELIGSVIYLSGNSVWTVRGFSLTVLRSPLLRLCDDLSVTENFGPFSYQPETELISYPIPPP